MKKLLTTLKFGIITLGILIPVLILITQFYYSYEIDPTKQIDFDNKIITLNEDEEIEGFVNNLDEKVAPISIYESSYGKNNIFK